MYLFFKSFHHYWGMFTFTMVLVLTVVAFIYYLQSRRISAQVRTISFFAVLTIHIQLLAGIVLLLTHLAPFHDMGELMSNSPMRRKYVEHPFSMLIAGILLTIVSAKYKRREQIPFWTFAVLLLSLGLIIYMIPLSFWQGLVGING